MTVSSRRVKYLNLIKIRLPLPGLVSIAHRISGVLMFLAIPFVAYLLHLSIQGADAYAQVLTVLGHPLIKLALLVIGWSVCHHLYAGIRYLLLDVDIGIELAAARASALVVMVAAIVSTLVILVLLL